MRTLKHLKGPAEISADFPDGAIKNQTNTAPGTPVVREVLGDPLSNIYAILKEAGISPNGLEDSVTNGYQLLDALKRLPNVLNDVEQNLTLLASEWSVVMAIENLPNNYVFYGRASEDYDPAQSYTFKGTGTTRYGFESTTGFKQGDTLLIVMDPLKVRAIGLTSLPATTNDDELSISLGVPLAYNDSAVLIYEDNGSILTDQPSQVSLQQHIRVQQSDVSIEVISVLALQSYVLCFCFYPELQSYKFFQFSTLDLSVPIAITILGISIPTGVDHSPYVFTDGRAIYISNNAGRSNVDAELTKLVYAPKAASLTYSSLIRLAVNYNKTTNTVIVGSDLFTLVSGHLVKYNLTNAMKTEVLRLKGNNGMLFQFNGSTYFSSEGLAKKWRI